MSESPAERLRRSQYHEAFLEHNQKTRDLEGARRLLTLEWRYLGLLLKGCQSPRVLELACGSGTQAIAWAERGARVYGIDFDASLLSVSRSRADEQLRQTEATAPTWTCGDATCLPFASGTFDVVFCNSLLEHVPQWDDVLREMSRALRPGGVVVIFTTNRFCPLQQEVNNFPFYSWLPAPIQSRVLDWIMKNRRDMVNFTDFPAVNWFTFPQMRLALESHDLEAVDRLDLGAKGAMCGMAAVIARAAVRWPVLKWGYYFYSISMAMYGVRRDSSEAARTQ